MNIFVQDIKRNISFGEAVVLAQLVERSLPTPQIHGLNSVIGKFYLLSTVFKKTVSKKRRLRKKAGNDPIKTVI